MKGYIFDFNGTMFFDGAKHDQAWRRFLEEKRGIKITREEFMEYVYGRTGHAILEHFLGKNMSAEEEMQSISEKEMLYRTLCMEDKEHLQLAGGLPEYLNSLRDRKCPMAIATAANRENMEFYFQVFSLEQWFSWDRVLYDDGMQKGKPEPDIYLRAASILGLQPGQCYIFEDSLSGLLSAKRAGAGRIIAVYGDSDYEMLQSQGLADFFIEDFRSMSNFK